MHSQQTRRAMRPGYIPVAGFRAQTFLQLSVHDAYLILLKATHAADAEKAPAFRCGDGFPLQGAGFPFAFHLHAAKLLHMFRFVESMELCLPTGSSVATSSPKKFTAGRGKNAFHTPSTQIVQLRFGRLKHCSTETVCFLCHGPGPAAAVFQK